MNLFRLIKIIIAAGIFALSGCSSMQSSNDTGYHWEVDTAKMQAVERSARRSSRAIRMVWIDPPKIRVKNKTEEQNN